MASKAKAADNINEKQRLRVFDRNKSIFNIDMRDMYQLERDCRGVAYRIWRAETVPEFAGEKVA